MILGLILTKIPFACDPEVDFEVEIVPLKLILRLILAPEVDFEVDFGP